MNRLQSTNRLLGSACLLFLAALPLACVMPGGGGATTSTALLASVSAPPVSPSAPSLASTAPTPAAPPPIRLSSDIPGDVTGSGSTLGTLQADFDTLSWNSFIALSWPVGPDGKVDPKARPGENGDNATVWESFREASSIFLPGGKAPTWSGTPDVPAVCKSSYKPGLRILRQTGKTILAETIQPFDTGPLIDQHGAFARFEISVNKPMFDYIHGNSLYSKAGQQVFTGAPKFPCGSAGVTGVEGAIMVKAAWKVLSDPAMDRARFHTSEVLVYTPASTNPKVQETCVHATVGLVGLHISHKTVSAAQWVWSTFEHVDNAPKEADVKSGNLKAAYNFYDPACKDCVVNKAAPRPWDPNKPSANHTQVVRLDPFSAAEAPIPASAKARNADAQRLLASVSAKSVWQNYELLSTQWPTNVGGNCTAKAADPFGTPAPQFLANTTLETFIQGKVPLASSSCIACHSNAAMTSGATADFTYLLQRAQ